MRVLVFEFVSLIYNKVLPLELLECTEADVDALIGSKTDIKLSLDKLILDYVLSHFHLRVELNHFEERSPLCKLLYPVRDG